MSQSYTKKKLTIAIVKAPVTIQMTRQFPRREVATIREKARVQTRSRELQPSEDPGSPEDRLMVLVLGPWLSLMLDRLICNMPICEE